jgi:drug/metabolite transporter (DMT)-like permease
MGIIVGLLNAFALAASSVFIKRLSGITPNLLTWVRFGTTIPVLAVLVSIFSEWFIPPIEYWLLLLLVIVPLEVAFAYLFVKSYHLSDMSVAAPLSAFSSIFLIPIGFVVLGELPTIVGFGGIVLIFFGSFFLGWRTGGKILYSWRNILFDKGALLSLLGALLASFAVAFAKPAFQYAPPLLSGFYTTLFLVLYLAPFTIHHLRSVNSVTAGDFGGLSITSGLSIALHYVGLSLLPAAYYISIKRLSIVFQVLFGKVFFKEGDIVRRFLGSLLMVAGVVLIALG